MSKKYIFSIFAAAIFLFWAAWQIRIPAPAASGQNPALQDKKAPPLLVLTTVALGGFRGLIVDILWMRLITIQAEGKVFEIAQLADWITKLEPQFTTVWAFHAWNMAYNISVLFSNPEHRWLWVKNGIQLLRDNALKYNAGDPVLYHDLGWLYQHKIGQDWDDMHLYYKVKLAREMTELFGGARPDFSLQMNQSVRNPPRPMATPPQEGNLGNPLLGGVREAGGGPESAKIKRMREEYKLYPEIMQNIEKYYGVLDWRLPESHAVYWAYRGLHEAAPGKDTGSCDHMIFQCLAAAFRHGRLFFDPDTGVYITTPLFPALPGVIKAYEDGIQRRHSSLFKTAYVNFLAEAVFLFHAYGQDQEAKKIFDKMLAEAPQLREKMNFEKYLHDCDQTDIAELPAVNAMAVIEGLLFQSYVLASAKSEMLRNRARMLCEQYIKNNNNRMTLKYFPSFELIDQQARQRAVEKRKEKQE